MSHISVQKFNIRQLNDKMLQKNLDVTLKIDESKLPLVHGHGLSSRATGDENLIGVSRLEQRFDATIENIDDKSVPGTGKKSKMSKMKD